ncbi:MAG: molecular chaperone Hsp90 [Phascolarctobacterium sp.]|nr:molecular chaperone Hsp90 [Phascolarctobacterium sp.]
MNKSVFVEAAQEAYNAPSACAELKSAAKKYLESIGKDDEDVARENLIAEAKVDIMTPAQVAAAMKLEPVIAALGKDTAAAIGAHAAELEAKGADYCDCPACAACAKLLANK